MNPFQPMQCSEYAPEKIQPRVLYTLQEKLDGICCIVLPDNRLQTRQGKFWNRDIMPDMPKNTTGYPVIGEFYLPGRPVADVMRVASVNGVFLPSALKFLQFSVFDVAMPDNAHHTSRLHAARSAGFHVLWPRMCKGFEQTNEPADDSRGIFGKTIDDYYKYVLDNRGEGIVVREYICPYIPGTVSPVQWKRKPVHTLEAQIIGYQRGLGKFRNTLGALQVIIPGTKIFFTVAGMDNAWRDEFWMCQKQYLNTLVTVAYDSLSADGVPLKPRVKVPRNYE